MSRRIASISIVFFALAGGACEWAPQCPPNSVYSNMTRRCTVQDAGPPRMPDAGGGMRDSGMPDAGESDAGGEDAGAVDGGSDAGGGDSGTDAG